MRTDLADVFAAGDCVMTHHRLLGGTYLPLGTTAHKQGRVAGENALGGNAQFAGSLGTQVVKVFELVAARTGLRDHEALAAGFDAGHDGPPTTTRPTTRQPPHRPALRATAHRTTSSGPARRPTRNRDRQARRHLRDSHLNDMTVDAMSDLDLSYTPPLGSPWDAVQAAAQAWVREHGSYCYPNV